MSWYENPGAEWTPDLARKPSSQSARSPANTSNPSNHYMESPVLHSSSKPSQSLYHESENRGVASSTGTNSKGTSETAASVTANTAVEAGRSVAVEAVPATTRLAGLVTPRLAGLVTPPCNPRRARPRSSPDQSRSRTLPRSWISSNYILVQKESLKDEDLVWL